MAETLPARCITFPLTLPTSDGAWPSWCLLNFLICSPIGIRVRSHQLPSLLMSSSAGAQPVLLLFLVFLLSSPGGVLTQVLKRT